MKFVIEMTKTTDLICLSREFRLYFHFCYLRRGRIIGSAAVLKTAVRKGMQVRVLSSPPFLFWILDFGF